MEGFSFRFHPQHTLINNLVHEELGEIQNFYGTYGFPAPGDNDIFALRKTGEMSVEGNLQPLMANLIYIKQVLAMPRVLMER